MNFSLFWQDDSKIYAKEHWESTLSKAEIMLIFILFHDSGNRYLKQLYLDSRAIQAKTPTLS